MAKSRSNSGKKRQIEQYEHTDKKRANNPPVGLVTPETDPDASRKRTYQYDPHLDPQLIWAGKAEHTSFEVPTVSLHVHERIDPRTIIAAVRRNGVSGEGTGASGQKREGSADKGAAGAQMPLFEQPRENPPLREAIEFYKHAHGWTNRLVAGDSLLVMNSLLEKEGMAGKVQMVYIDPPYGIRYGSNFQPFVNKRDVKDGKDDDLNQEPEMIRAFRDTWELGIHSYLTYMRDRLLLARELLHESGSCFVQISDENIHIVRSLVSEVFGESNFCALVTFRKKTMPMGSDFFEQVSDYLLWYAKDSSKVKTRPLFRDKVFEGDLLYRWIELPDGIRRSMRQAEIEGKEGLPAGSRVYRLVSMLPAQYRPNQDFEFEFEGKIYPPPKHSCWKTTREGMKVLGLARRLQGQGGSLQYILFAEDFPVTRTTALWDDTAGPPDKRYVVQTANSIIQRCLLATTDPGDLVLDPTCGSGTTAFVAEQWGRRWITCDTSRVATTLAKQRLTTAVFDYYELAHPNEGVVSGFKYKTVPHVTLKSIANNPEIREGMTKVEIDKAIAKYADQETLYDQPYVDNSRARVTGPFTVEAVPAPSVRTVDSGEWTVDSGEHTDHSPLATDHSSLATNHFATSAARSGPTLRQDEWRGEMLKCGIRGKGGQTIQFSRVEPLAGTRRLHADAETDDQERMRVVVSFGPEHAPLEQRQVAEALEEANKLVPRPKIVIFASFQFDPEAAKDIDETNWPGVTLLKVQMNTDLLTDDLKKKRASNESFWMIGQPDIGVVSEQWLVDSGGRVVCPYELGKVLSGFDRLAEINGLDPADLRFYGAISQSGDVWSDRADAAGGGVDPGQHRGGTGAEQHGGVSAVSGHSPGLIGRIGNAARLIERLGLRAAKQRGAFVERVRGNKQITQRAAQIAIHAPLTTRHYAQVEVRGFDYYNPVRGVIQSGDAGNIAMWMLDTDYDGRSLYPRQVFFPMAGEKDGWARLARSLKAEIDVDLIEAYRGTVSLPFELGEHKRVAVKIVDDRGIESLKIVGIETEKRAP